MKSENNMEMNSGNEPEMKTGNELQFGNENKTGNELVEFTAYLTKSPSITVAGCLETNNADDEKPIEWYDNQTNELSWNFPKNLYDMDLFTSEYIDYEELKLEILSDSMLIQFLCDFATDTVTIIRDKYTLEINSEE